MTSSQAQNLVSDISNLISLPEVVLRINDMVYKEDTSASDIGALLSQDPGLSTRILKIANSALYGGSRNIDDINRAVTFLGIKQIQDLVLSTTAAHAFDGIPNDLISVEDFWHHSLYCGLLSRTLARHTRKVNMDTMFTAGLLHDIGHLIMFYRIPQHAHEAILMTVQGESIMDLPAAEQAVMGFDHTQVGAALAELWHLPSILEECIAFHHHPENAKLHPLEVIHVHIANAVASLPYSDIPSLEEMRDIRDVYWERLSIDDRLLAECIEEARAQMSETQELLFGQAA
jgi:putative nucleotidyltransferase with HDIG domain